MTSILGDLPGFREYSSETGINLGNGNNPLLGRETPRYSLFLWGAGSVKTAQN